MTTELLPTITTITPGAWRNKIKEVSKLKLKTVAIFPTCLNQAERQELYSLLEKTSVKSIPFVHLRNDMAIGELDYLVQNYQTKVFNTHTSRENPFPGNDYSKYRDIIYVEGVDTLFDEEELKQLAGICVDFSHLENDRLSDQEKYQHHVQIIEKHQVGCSHISAVKEVPIKDKEHHPRYATHFLANLSELDYLKKYPGKYFGAFSAMELENTIAEQLKAQEYIIHLLTESRKAGRR